MDFSITRDFIEDQCKTALSQNVVDYTENDHVGLIQLMYKKGKAFSLDIPAVTECYSLLSYVLEQKGEVRTLPLTVDRLVDVNSLLSGVYVNSDNTKCLLILTVGSGELRYIAHWIADRIRSNRVVDMPGKLFLTFTIERRGDLPFMLPDWCGAYYVDSNPEQCVPIITLQSVLTNSAISGDWILSALYRLQSFNLPVDKAITAAEEKRP
ncbi:hypothetical protein SJI19_16595 [Acerihabitans sp. TG2]|uniref:hypothetical protein n=1 Tax=Acerihabitans sp. TG2 TaxID=3096008 RepID=UPI002B225D43|nr:hypothetical protein [Acerihabitans sp. TG2]MEA9392144.1 hypothetical protein [Acerihabitans sp. TG2]